MHCYAVYSLLLLIYIFPIITAYTATDFILLSCGDSVTSNDTSHRSWDGDERSRYVPSSAASISSASEASSMESSVFEVPYKTARVFQSSFTYTFPVSTGQKFLRLYFYPNVYSGLDTTQSFFSLTANAFTLFTNFSAFLYSKNSSQPSFMVEFIVNIGATQGLDLTFTPNPKSTAFVNGIEIVSIPDKLYFRGDDIVIKFVDQVFYLNNNTALENLYRLNVGGGRVKIKDDSGPTRGMFRGWNPDDYYIYSDYGWTLHREGVPINYTTQTPPYAAPPIVYTTARIMSNISKSLEWGFPVDSGFLYLLRFHFCEFMQEIRKQNERVFTIYINNQTADIVVDVIFMAGGPQIPIFRDYIIYVPDYEGRRGKQDLRLSLAPALQTGPKYLSALLNGLEIFKLNDTGGSLAAANPELIVEPLPTAMTPPRQKRGRGNSLTYAITGGAIIVVAVVAMSFLIIQRRRKVNNTGATSGSDSGASLLSTTCTHFSIDQIRAATRHFDDKLVVGEGGFGKVYKGLIDNATTTVAIKRLNPSSNQGVREFLTEIKMLSKLRHLNLVSLVGYCNDYGEMILVYDYMAHGTLRSHLHGSEEKTPLTWNQRLKICLGAAKGLQYLHTGAEHAIIHRDVKTTNILLDERWVAKMSDFGLSKVGPTGGAHTHVSTAVKGSFGYMDPEYYRRRQVTEKSDVYSFGVVLFEVLCGRPAVVSSLPIEEASLAVWAKFCIKERTLEKIVDVNLNGQIAPECFNRFVETAAACVRDKGIERPSMNDVVWSLEFALQLQETAVESSEGGMSSSLDGEVSESSEISLLKKNQNYVSLPSSSSSDVEIAGNDLNLNASKASI